MRILLDTNIFIYYSTDKDMLSRNVIEMMDSYDTTCVMSMESIKELIVAYNNKNYLNKFWVSARKMIDSITTDYNIKILPVDMNVMRTYSELEINTAQGHKDPSDHIIISHAITLGLPLVSSDSKFPFYRQQGLELIENEV